MDNEQSIQYIQGCLYDANDNEVIVPEGKYLIQGKDAFCYVDAPTYIAKFIYRQSNGTE
jgi:hypothetical protein